MSDADPFESLGPPEGWDEPSPVPGISRGEYEEMAEQIRFYGGQTLEQKLRSIARHIEEDRALRRLQKRPRARADDAG